MVSQKIEADHLSAVLTCHTTLPFPCSAGARDYEIKIISTTVMDNSSNMDVLSLIDNTSTSQHKECEVVPEPTGSVLPYLTGGLEMDSRQQDQASVPTD